MRKRAWHLTGAVLLAISVALVIWQGSFTFGEWAPASIEETYLFWAISTLIFLLMVTLGFMLFRTGVKLYIERQANRGRAGIKTKMVIGALALSFVPVFFLVLFSISVLNRNLEKWFSRPAVNVRESLVEVSEAFAAQTVERGEALAAWLAGRADLRRFVETGTGAGENLSRVCAEQRLEEVFIERPGGEGALVCEAFTSGAGGGAILRVRYPLGEAEDAPVLVLALRIPVDLAAKQREIAGHIAEYDQLAANRKNTRWTYLLLLGLITLFILFVATWIALFLAKQINVPIAALLAASDEVRRGNLGHRVKVQAIDELAVLVQSFNEMTTDLDQNARELESRRRFIEAILENVPAGVISAASDGRIQVVNRALKQIYPAEHVEKATHIAHLFAPEDASEIHYLMN
ncbi:MAG: HAMP domain-containing protein, partial [bacterium]|nr:HAMP domain-containing protein [bacterium]